ncbi:MAG TPA: substrate-binding domain-containing protein [Gemmatimonadaceae bacterium]|nr:substrate-binding domain-containing protein [Gemmatimonadaceae bacterium]
MRSSCLPVRSEPSRPFGRSRGLAGSALVLLGMGLSGCGGAKDNAADSAKGAASAAAAPAATPSAAPSTGKTFTIAMIAKSSTNPVFLSGRQGAEDAAKELTAKTGVQVTIDWLTPPEEDATVQAQRIADAVNGGANAILLSASDASKLVAAVNDAVQRGVPVMTFDSDVPGSNRFSFYGGDDIAMGKQVMDELAKQMGGKGKIGILAGNQNAPNLQKRVQGVKEAAKAYPGITILGTFYHAETPQDAAAEVLREQNAYPDLQGWAMIGGWPLFTSALLTDLDPAKVKIVAVDALPAELAYVDKGLAPVLFAQPTYDWGFVSVHTIFDHVYLKKDVPAHVQMDLVRVSKDNLGTWARQLKAWGFTDVDPKYLALAK